MTTCLSSTDGLCKHEARALVARTSCLMKSLLKTFYSRQKNFWTSKLLKSKHHSDIKQYFNRHFGVASWPLETAALTSKNFWHLQMSFSSEHFLGHRKQKMRTATQDQTGKWADYNKARQAAMTKSQRTQRRRERRQRNAPDDPRSNDVAS